MTKKVLHILSQRPLLTGSGITLDALVRHAGAAGWKQRVVCGIPANAPQPAVGGLPAARILPLRFGAGTLDFAVPGMSDVMPYPSMVWSAMTPAQLDSYRRAWRDHLQPVLADFKPDVIHAHHVWLLASLLKDVAPDVPVVNHCHATGLRQMELCSHLADDVKTGCARNERFVVLHTGHAEALAQALGVPANRIEVVGAGYRDDIFYAEDRAAGITPDLLYIGKYSAAKGLPQLLDAVETLAARHPDLRLHVAGTGAGAEAEALRQRMELLAPVVVLHGQVSQPELAALMRQCAVCVLPSFYEGVPLVLVEALACGCRLAATELPGVVDQLAPHLGPALELVPLPRLVGPDVPAADELPAFVARLTAAIETALQKPSLRPETMQAALLPFTWGAVFERIERVWQSV
jgi:glycosyltransferase involved in cell wall biosynthesis